MRGGRRNRGFTLVVVLFILTVLVTLGLHIGTMSGAQHRTALSSLLGMRAHFAARSGLEWAVQDVVNNAGAGIACGGTNFSLIGGATAGFDIAITCTTENVTEGGSTYGMWRISATATFGSVGSADYASRTLMATIAR